jgi:hypothetical protein
MREVWTGIKVVAFFLFVLVVFFVAAFVSEFKAWKRGAW